MGNLNCLCCLQDLQESNCDIHPINVNVKEIYNLAPINGLFLVNITEKKRNAIDQIDQLSRRTRHFKDLKILLEETSKILTATYGLEEMKEYIEQAGVIIMSFIGKYFRVSKYNSIS